jgi:hypothetical protein
VVWNTKFLKFLHTGEGIFELVPLFVLQEIPNIEAGQEDAGEPRDTPRGHSKSQRPRCDRQNRRRERDDLLEYREKNEAVDIVQQDGTSL